MFASTLFAVVLGLPAAPGEGWEDALQTLRGATTFDGPMVGDDGIESENHRAYAVLRDEAPTDTLVTLAADPAPLVRAYALRALVEGKRSVDAVTMLLAAASDRQPIETYSGCILAEEPLGEALVDECLELLAPDLRPRLVEGLLDLEHPTSSVWRVLRNETFSPALLPRLRALADGGETAALVALARSQDPADVGRIERALRAPAKQWVERYDALRAAELYGDAVFLEALLALESEVGRVAKEMGPERMQWFVRAILRHDDPRVEGVLLTYLRSPARSDYDRLQRAESVAECLAGGRCANFDRVTVQLAELGTTRKERLEALAARDRARATTLARDLLARPADARTALATRAAGEFLFATDPAGALESWSEALARSTSADTASLCAVVATLHESRAIEVLERRFLGSDNPYVYLPSAAALLCFDDPAIDAWLGAVPEKSGWGAERLRSLLERKPREFHAD